MLFEPSRGLQVTAWVPSLINRTLHAYDPGTSRFVLTIEGLDWGASKRGVRKLRLEPLGGR